ncbi:hypothetical protein ACN2C6_15900 [Caulobacter sp. ErkDOM-YI]|uniref:hypothetical protein n=1 Tax=unclassified Caulobacter TaxID=2648921 RepID=UPI003AF8F82D
MKPFKSFGLIALGALALCAAPALAGERDCFDSRQVNNWAAVGDQTLLLRVGTSDYYQIDLSRPVKHIRSPLAKLALVSREGRICHVGDLDPRILFGPQFTMGLPVAGLHRLNEAEQAAIGETNLPGRHYRRRNQE